MSSAMVVHAATRRMNMKVLNPMISSVWTAASDIVIAFCSKKTDADVLLGSARKATMTAAKNSAADTKL